MLVLATALTTAVQLDTELVFRVGAVLDNVGACAGGDLISDGYALFASMANGSVADAAAGTSQSLAVTNWNRSLHVPFHFNYTRLRDNCSLVQHTDQVARLLHGDQPINFLLGSNVFTESESRQAYLSDVLAYHCCVSTNSLFQQGWGNVFSIETPNTFYLKLVIDAMAFRNVASLMVVYNTDTEYTNSTCAAGIDYFKASIEHLTPDMNLTKVVRYTSAQAAVPGFLQALVAQASTLRVQGFIACDTPANGVVLNQQIGNQSVYLQAFYILSASTVTNYSSLVGPSGQYVLSNLEWSPELMGDDDFFGTSADYSVLFRSTYRRRPSGDAAAASAVGWTLASAIMNAAALCDWGVDAARGGVDVFLSTTVMCRNSRGQWQATTIGDTVNTALWDLVVSTFYGPVGFGFYRQNILKPASVGQLDGENFALVLPATALSSSLVMPIPLTPQQPAPAVLSTELVIVIIVLSVLLGLAILALALLFFMRGRLAWLQNVDQLVTIDFDDLEVKQVPRVILDCHNGTLGEEVGMGLYRGIYVALEPLYEVIERDHLDPAFFQKEVFMGPDEQDAKQQRFADHLDANCWEYQQHWAKRPWYIPYLWWFGSRSLSRFRGRRPFKHDRTGVTQLVWLLARLQHPNIVRVLGVCYDFPGCPVPVQVSVYDEYGSLSVLLDNKTVVIDVIKKVDIALDIAAALHYIHTQENLHVHGAADFANMFIDRHFVAQLELRVGNLDHNSDGASSSHILGEGSHPSHRHGTKDTAHHSSGEGTALRHTHKGSSGSSSFMANGMGRNGSHAGATASGMSQIAGRRGSHANIAPSGNGGSSMGMGQGGTASGPLGGSRHPRVSGGGGGGGSSRLPGGPDASVSTSGRLHTTASFPSTSQDRWSPTTGHGAESVVAGRNMPQDMTILLADELAAAASGRDGGDGHLARVQSSAPHVEILVEQDKDWAPTLGPTDRTDMPPAAARGSSGGDGRDSGSSNKGLRVSHSGSATVRQSANGSATGSSRLYSSSEAHDVYCYGQILCHLFTADCRMSDPLRDKWRLPRAPYWEATKNAARQELRFRDNSAALRGASNNNAASAINVADPVDPVIEEGGNGTASEGPSNAKLTQPSPRPQQEPHLSPGGGGAVAGGAAKAGGGCSGPLLHPDSVMVALLAEINPPVAELVRKCLLPIPLERPSFIEVCDMLEQAAPDIVNLHNARSRRSGSMGIYTNHNTAAEELLYEVFPPKVADQLRAGREVVPEPFECVSVFFSDIVGFTDLCSQLPPDEVMSFLHCLYTKLDASIKRLKLFKVETIGDAYMAVGNLRWPQPEDHARRLVEFAFEAIQIANSVLASMRRPELGYLNIRVGLHAGPVVASVVGTLNRRFCLFGNTVNVASRMESNSLPNRVHCSSDFFQLAIKQWPELHFESRGLMVIKGKGNMSTFFLNPPSEHSRLSSNPSHAHSRASQPQQDRLSPCGGAAGGGPLSPSGIAHVRISDRDSVKVISRNSSRSRTSDLDGANSSRMSPNFNRSQGGGSGRSTDVPRNDGSMSRIVARAMSPFANASPGEAAATPATVGGGSAAAASARASSLSPTHTMSFLSLDKSGVGGDRSITAASGSSYWSAGVREPSRVSLVPRTLLALDVTRLSDEAGLTQRGRRMSGQGSTGAPRRASVVRDF